MLTDDQITEIVAPFTEIDSGSLVSFYPSHLFAACRAIEQIARREALEGAIAALSKRVTGDKSEGDFETQRCIEAIRALMGEEG